MARTAKIITMLGLLALWGPALAMEGSGTEEDPYIITNVEELQAMSNDLGAYYVLGNDIDASDTRNWNAGAGFQPVGSPFTGTLDGQRHTITGLYIYRPSAIVVGLFKEINYAEIKNVGLIDVEIYGDYRVGSLVGSNHWESNVTCCYATGQMIISASGSSDTKSGGLVGGNGNSTISQCYSAVNVTALSSRAQLGGLCGYSSARSGDPPALIVNCYSTGTVTSNGDKVGGLLGDADGINSTVSNCYSVGQVNGNYKKGLVGYTHRDPTIIDSYWDTQTSTCTSSEGGGPKTTAEMMQQATFVGWDFIDVWNIMENEGYPFLRCFGFVPPRAFDPNPADGAIQVDPNVIFSWSPGSFAADVNGHDVYFGTDYNDVNDANTTVTLGVYKGRQDVNFYDPCGLEIVTTYYWRIDEVNDACDDSPWKGNIWSFKTETPSIELSAAQFEFFADEGGPNPPDQILTIRNAGGSILNWTITYDCGWLSVDPNSGSSTGEANDVTLSVDITGLTWGVYECSLTISDPCAENNPQTVAVTLDVLGPVIELSATGFGFSANEGGPNPPDQILTISNSGGGTLNWVINYDCSWLSAEPNTGSSTGQPNDVTLSVNVSGLAWGTYDCNLIVSDPCAENSPKTAAVTLDVLGPVIELSATEFEFFADEGGPNPPDQTLTIRNAGGPTLNWTITYDCGWLSVDPNSGSSTGETNDVTLSVDIAGLTCGPYDCILTISDPCAENSPRIVTVTLVYCMWDYPVCWDFAGQCKGDTDNDAYVGNLDFLYLKAAYMAVYPAGKYNPCADFDRNGYIGGLDFLILKTHYLETGLTGCLPGDPYEIYKP